MTRVRLRIHGRVQGVWFRESTRREAERHGVAGWVANRPDGSVEAVLEGASDAVAAVSAWARAGPPGARVERVEETSEEPQGADGFAVR